MCKYIKDNDEQCGREAEPFCHDHAETIQAVQYELNQVRSQIVPESSLSDSSAIEMDTSCDHCEAPLRRTERLTEHERLGGQLVFEAVVECDCGEHVLGSQPVRTSNLPAGWT